MLTTKNHRIGLWLFLLFVGTVIAGWAAIACAQSGSPTTSPINSPVATPGAIPQNGTPFSSPSPSTNPFGGGMPNLGGSPANNQFRGGFNGSWLVGQSNSNRTSPTNGPPGTPGGLAPGPFSAYYVNPLATGAPGVSSLAAFNTPIYWGGALGMQGGPPPVGNTPFNAGPNPQPGIPGNGPSPAVRRGPSYTASPAFEDRPAGPNVNPSEVERMLARSTALRFPRQIHVVVEELAIVLRGSVASEGDRRLAESLVRLTPGVYQVRNELRVAVISPQPGPGQKP
jgi:hypothetical protein